MALGDHISNKLLRTSFMSPKAKVQYEIEDLEATKYTSRS